MPPAHIYFPWVSQCQGSHQAVCPHLLYELPSGAWTEQRNYAQMGRQECCAFSSAQSSEWPPSQPNASGCHTSTSPMFKHTKVLFMLS